MTANMQLLTFIFSFLYGIIASFLFKLNYKIVNNLKRVFNNILTIIFTLDVLIIYVILVYYLNNGYLHIYFIVILLLGIYVGLSCLKGVKLRKIYVKIRKRT